MGVLSGGTRAPSTPRSHLRSYTWGNVVSWSGRAGNRWPGSPAGRRCSRARTSWPSPASAPRRSGSLPL